MLKPRLHGWNMHMVGRTGKVIDVFGEVGVRIEARAGGRLEVQGSLRAAALMGVPGAAREQARSHRSSSQPQILPAIAPSSFHVAANRSPCPHLPYTALVCVPV